MYIKKINKIYRVGFRYIRESTSGVRTYSYMWFPSEIAQMKNQIYSYSARYIPTIEEQGILNLHDLIYNPEHKILAVGVGSGHSLIYNCLNQRINRFTAIEASSQSLELTKLNARLNGVDTNRFNIINGYVGFNDSVYGPRDQVSSMRINIHDYDFDLLELDCEGCEYEILLNLEAKPKFIIVETHPNIIYININELISTLNRKGFRLKIANTVNGINVNLDEVLRYFTSSNIKNMNEGVVSYGDGLLVLLFELDQSLIEL